MKMLLIMGLLLFSGTAIADGFICVSAYNNLEIKSFNHTERDQGTRNASVLILSDLAAEPGDKTIAVFRSEDDSLVNDGSTYIAYPSSHQRKAHSTEIDGIKLGNLYSLVLDVEFSYSKPVKNGAKLPGELILVTDEGDKLFYDLNCRRYLKSSSAQ